MIFWIVALTVVSILLIVTCIQFRRFMRQLKEDVTLGKNRGHSQVGGKGNED